MSGYTVFPQTTATQPAQVVILAPTGLEASQVRILYVIIWAISQAYISKSGRLIQVLIGLLKVCLNKDSWGAGKLGSWS